MQHYDVCSCVGGGERHHQQVVLVVDGKFRQYSQMSNDPFRRKRLKNCCYFIYLSYMLMMYMSVDFYPPSFSLPLSPSF